MSILTVLVSMMMLSVTFIDLRALLTARTWCNNGLRGANIWHWPDRDYHEMLERYYADPLHADSISAKAAEARAVFFGSACSVACAAAYPPPPPPRAAPRARAAAAPPPPAPRPGRRGGGKNRGG